MRRQRAGSSTRATGATSLRKTPVPLLMMTWSPTRLTSCRSPPALKRVFSLSDENTLHTCRLAVSSSREQGGGRKAGASTWFRDLYGWGTQRRAAQHLLPGHAAQRGLPSTAALTWAVPTSLLVGLCPVRAVLVPCRCSRIMQGQTGLGVGSFDTIRVKVHYTEGALWGPENEVKQVQ